MGQEANRIVSLVSGERLRVLGSEVIPVSQLEGWFGTLLDDKILEIAKKHHIGVGGASRNAGTDIIELMVWLDSYTRRHDIHKGSVVVAVAGSLRALMSEHLNHMIRQMLHSPKHDPANACEQTSKTDKADWIMGFPMVRDEERNYIYIPFHPLIEIEALDDD